MSGDVVNDNFAKTLSEWLSKEGYVLEYATMHALRAAGLKASMGYHITSRDGSIREIDVTANSKAAKDENDYFPYVIRVVCECKYTMEKPWVILQSGLGSGLPEDWQSLPHSERTHDIGNKLNEDLWHFKSGRQVGHTITQAFRKDNRDNAFSSLQKIANAAWDWVLADERNGYSSNLICIPAIVLQGDLFEAWCPEGSDQFQVNQVSFGRLSWSGAQNGTMVDVVTQAGLAEWAQHVRKTIDGIFQICNVNKVH